MDVPGIPRPGGSWSGLVTRFWERLFKLRVLTVRKATDYPPPTHTVRRANITQRFPLEAQLLSVSVVREIYILRTEDEEVCFRVLPNQVKRTEMASHAGDRSCSYEPRGTQTRGLVDQDLHVCQSQTQDMLEVVYRAWDSLGIPPEELVNLVGLGFPTEAAASATWGLQADEDKIGRRPCYIYLA